MDVFLPEGYTLLKTISENQYRKVSIIKSNTDGRKYISKWYNKGKLMQNKAMVQWVLNEKKALSELKHSKINSLKDTFKDDDHIGFVLELAKGIGLSDILHSQHQIPAELVQIIVWQLAEIFEYLHNKGYVYKDLKASHIFVDRFAKIHLIDLGMIEELKPGARSHIPAGTFHSMAPEMIEIWESSIKNDGVVNTETWSGYTHKIDLYAIGVFIHELLLGKPPHGYLQATADKEHRLEYFEKVKNGINSEDMISEKLGEELSKTEESLLSLMNKLLQYNEEERISIETLKAHEIFDEIRKNEDEVLVNFVKKNTSKSKTNKISDILSFIETCGEHNNSDYDEDEILNDEEQKMFDDF